jgi:nucleoside-diphosphate-sugar epimerase
VEVIMRALVVGGAGSTGPLIVAGLLQRGYQVSVLHRGLHEADLPSDVEHIHADPHWREGLQAALEGRRFDLAMAIYGRLRLVAEALQGRTDRLISVGGALAAYKGWMRVTDEHPWDTMEESPVPVREDDALASAPGVDHFSEQVRDSEKAVMQAHAEGRYNATHFRYPIVYGPRHIGVPEWSIIRRVRDGRKRVILPGGGMALLSRGYAGNIAHGLMLAVDQPQASSGQTYNICDDRVLYNREWVRMTAALLGWQFEFVEIPFDMLPPGFRAAPTQTLFRWHRVMDTSRIKAQLGYVDATPVEQALAETVRWYTERPLPPRGEIEQNLGDPFDYEVEDQLMHMYESGGATLRERLRAGPAARVLWRHPYPHPRKPGDVR